jgi:nicotinamidase/pyrazinamidase
VIAVANRLQASRRDWLVVATLDWHPPHHGSFASQHPGRTPYERIDLHGLDQVLWPDHCVQYTHGASFATALDTSRIQRVFTKGTDPELDSYSGFFDNARRSATGLGDWLRVRGVRRVTVLGLATDFCVRATVLDACSLGFVTTLVVDGCRGVDVRSGESEAAIAAMAAAGARVTTSSSVALTRNS